MGLCVTRKYGAAATVDCFALRTAGATTIKTAPTLAAGDVKISKDAGTLANLTTLPVETPASSGQLRISLSATEMQAARIWVRFVDAAGAEWQDDELTIETFGHASAQFPPDYGSADAGNRLNANAAAISEDSTAADNLELFFDGTGYNATASGIGTVEDVSGGVASIGVGGIVAASFGAGAINAAAIAADAIGASELAADAVAEIVAAFGSATININQPVDPDSDALTLIQGDDHATGDRLPTWTVTGYTGPSLAAATGKLRLITRAAYRQPAGSPEVAVLEVTATVTQVSTTVTITAALTAAQTTLLASTGEVGQPTHDYQVIATTSGGAKATLALGPCVVRRHIPAS